MFICPILSLLETRPDLALIRQTSLLHLTGWMYSDWSDSRLMKVSAYSLDKYMEPDGE